MRMRVGLVAALLLVASAASAQLLLFGVGSGGFGGGVASACGAGQLDFSNSCNTVFFTGAMTP